MTLKSERIALLLLRCNWFFKKFGYEFWWEYEYHCGKLIKSHGHWRKVNESSDK